MDFYQDEKCMALEKALEDKSVEPIDLPFLFLKAITKDFSENEKIGSGGFGAVYMGALRNGGVVAVKKLYDYIEVLEVDFRREVGCLAEVKHKNILRFLGYCSETQHVLAPYEERLFCFEYLSKGSLAKYLTETSSRHQWRERYQIIKGICEGMGYLHKQRIIHMDLKPQNILLDDDMVPKIADFGISWRFGENQTRIITENRVGPWGYMAPEFYRSGKITLKTDIYSLGVIIMEILTGQKEDSNIANVLESWASTLGVSESHPLLKQVQVCAEIGIKCKDDDPGNRPAIHDIIHMLDKADVDSSVLVDGVKPMLVSSKIERSVMSRFGQYYLMAQKTCKPMQISASKISGEITSEAITKDFADGQRIGWGGFGAVYKGALPNEKMVAVKKLHNHIEVLEENFESEIHCHIGVNHKNTVRLIGFCSETHQILKEHKGRYILADVRQRLFCFEYLKKGSLANYLAEASSGLQWMVRYQIIKGICEGVHYLHRRRIIHMDLKPENILLDDGMMPKITDFGISRRLTGNQSSTITEHRFGSLGYLAPEFLKTGTITLKTDIYSLGVIIIEIMMGCKERHNINKVLESWKNTFGTSESHPLKMEQVKICAEIGINCMDDNPVNRPHIQDIISQLDAMDHSSSSVIRSVTSTTPVQQLVDSVESMTVSSAVTLREQSALE